MDRNEAQEKIHQEIHQGCFRLFLILVGSGIVLGIVAYVFSQDAILYEKKLDTTCTVHVQAETGWWEICMWVHLSVRREGMENVHSASIACYHPSEIKAKNLHLAIEQIGDIGIVYDTREPDILLALIGLDSPIVYPASGIQEDDFYAHVQEMFCTVRTRTENEHLQLRGAFAEYSCDNIDIE